MTSIQSAEIDPHLHSVLVFTKVPRLLDDKWKAFSINGAKKNEYQYRRTWPSNSTLHSEQKSIWEKPRYKTKTTAFLKKTYEGYLRNWRVRKDFFLMFIFVGERQHEWGKNRERGRHRIWSRLQALSCQHRVWCGARTPEPWDHDLSWSRTLNRLSHPGAPCISF